MANRNKYKNRYSLEREECAVRAHLTWASGVPTLVAAQSEGVASVTDGGVGNFTLTLEDVWQELLAWNVRHQVASGADPGYAKASAVYTAASKTLQIKTRNERKILHGGLLVTPTNASTQATGAGETDANVNISACVACLNGTVGEVVAAADFAVHATTIAHASFDSGDSIIAAIVIKNVAGTFTFDKVLGTPAVTGAQVAPTGAAIQAAMDAASALDYAILGYVTLNRTADTTVTQSQSNTGRTVTGSVVDPADGTMIVELDLRNY